MDDIANGTGIAAAAIAADESMEDDDVVDDGGYPIVFVRLRLLWNSVAAAK